ncbi:MAG TPA: SDR family NAD(P)-dependent oxidoreductase [Bacteroidetes bacterium]|nr:SDR family NAD(P)-dependent oxidoreductase [Bacteroidota bacterium]
MDIKNKIALVTGASKGIGRETALALAREGAHIAISARSEELLQEVAGEVRAAGSKALVFPGDMSDEKTIAEFVEATIAEFGRLDILINNAGVGIFGPVAELSTEDWDTMFNLNMRGVFLMTRTCLPHLRAAGESVVVNVASLAGKNAFVGGGGYAATKHALLGFSRCLMLEERQHGLRVLAICPGSVNTPFNIDRSPADDPRRRRIIQPEDVAATILHMIRMPQHTMISEIDMRPSNP